MRKLNITVLGKTYEVLVEDCGNVTAETPAPRENAPAPAAAPAPKTPVPVSAVIGGVVLGISVKPGDNVCSGDELCVIEANSAENSVTAPYDGVIRQICIRLGENVEKDALLFTMEVKD